MTYFRGRRHDKDWLVAQTIVTGVWLDTPPADEFALRAWVLDSAYPVVNKPVQATRWVVPAWMQSLLWERDEHRKAKRWAEADRIRQDIRSRGYNILDTAAGPELEVIRFS